MDSYDYENIDIGELRGSLLHLGLHKATPHEIFQYYGLVSLSCYVKPKHVSDIYDELNYDYEEADYYDINRLQEALKDNQEIPPLPSWLLIAELPMLEHEDTLNALHNSNRLKVLSIGVSSPIDFESIKCCTILSISGPTVIEGDILGLDLDELRSLEVLMLSWNAYRLLDVPDMPNVDIAIYSVSNLEPDVIIPLTKSNIYYTIDDWLDNTKDSLNSLIQLLTESVVQQSPRSFRTLRNYMTNHILRYTYSV